MSSKWLQGLNPEQISAVQHNYGPLLILAGAGSGKTTVLVARTGRLIEEKIVSPDELCVLTFTNKAARELKNRVTTKLGESAKKIWAGTFHSFGLRILKKYYRQAGLPKEFGILDASDASAIAKELLRDFNNMGKTAYDAEKLVSLLSDWREAGRKEANSDDEYQIAVEWLLPRYLKRLEHLGMVDFDGLILKPVELMKQNPDIYDSIQNTFRQVMVDEFQDTNRMQMALIQRLVANHQNLSVVGDDDQSIYGWRGACVANILGFPKIYPKSTVVRLEQNYRSTPSILKLANAVIAQNSERHKKVLRPQGGEEGELPELFVYDTENEEAESVAAEINERVRRGEQRKDIAVLYRSNSQGALLEAELRRVGTPYAISGGTAFFDRKEIRDVLGYLRCAIKPNEIAFRRIINTPPRGIGDKSVEILSGHAHAKNLPFVEVTRRWREVGVDERSGTSIDCLFELLRGFAPALLDTSKGKPGDLLL